MDLWDKTLVDKEVEVLVSSPFPSAKDSWRTRKAVDTVVSEIRTALPKTQLLIERSECWRLYNTGDELRSQLKGSICETQGIVGELEYQRSKTKVKRVLDRLNEVYDKLKKLCDSHGIPENPNQFSKTARPITSRFFDPYTVYGRDKELNEVIRLMGVPVSNSNIGESSSRMDMNQNVSVISIVGMEGIGKTTISQMVCNELKNVSVISIVGMEGVGKTTIAQMVCNESSVKSYFDLIMWVCVSDNSDLVRLTKETIESATLEEVKLTSLDVLPGTLQKALNSKRFLLVLDEVWTKDWQRLLLPMNEASQGSVVLVTTRSLDCVKMPGTSIGSRGVIKCRARAPLQKVTIRSCLMLDETRGRDINGKLPSELLEDMPLSSQDRKQRASSRATK